MALVRGLLDLNSIFFVFAMPGYFCGVAGYARVQGGSRHFASIRPRFYAYYDWRRSVYDLDFPMNSLVMAGTYAVTQAELEAYVQRQSMHWYYGMCQRSYDGDLDLYVRFADGTDVHQYKLGFSNEVDIGSIVTEHYPQAADYFFASTCTYVRSIPAEEWAAMGVYDDVPGADGDAMGAPIAAEAPDAEGAPMDA